MPTCPSGHSSDDADYCDVCGIRMAGDGGDTGSTPASSSTSSPAPAPSGDPCPECGEALTERFCESCGYDRENPAQTPPARVEPAAAAAASWLAVVGIDRAYYDRVVAELGADPDELPFPAYTPERLLPLQAPHVRIGRRSQSGGFVPEIDLSKPPEDPAVSHEHAVLLPKPDDSWVLVDLGSTNGTTVNDATAPVAANVEVPLQEGDRVYVGAWTVVTVKRA